MTDKQITELYSISQELYKEVFGLYGEHKKQVKERLLKELRDKGYIK